MRAVCDLLFKPRHSAHILQLYDTIFHLFPLFKPLAKTANVPLFIKNKVSLKAFSSRWAKLAEDVSKNYQFDFYEALSFISVCATFVFY